MLAPCATSTRRRGRLTGMQLLPAQRSVGHRVAGVEDPRLLTGHGQLRRRRRRPRCCTRRSCAAPTRTPSSARYRRRRGTPSARRRRGLHRRRHRSAHQPVPRPRCRSPASTTRCTTRSPSTGSRMVGDPVAMVVATSRYAAEDAVELVQVDYEQLEPIATIEHALDPPPPGDLARRPRQRDVRRPRDEYGDVDARVRARRPRRVASGSCSTGTRTSRWRRAACVAEVDRRRARSPTTRPRRTRHDAEVVARPAHRSAARPGGRSSISPRQRARLAGARRRPAVAFGQRSAGAGRVDSRRHRPPPLTKPSTPASPHRDAAAVPARAGALVAPRRGSLRRAPRQGPGHVATRAPRRTSAARSARRRCAPARTSRCVAAAIDLGRSIKWIEDRNEHLVVGAPGARRAHRRRRRVRRRRHPARPARAPHDGPGRVPGVPVRRGDVHARSSDDDARAVPLPGLPLRRHGRRVEQGDLRRLPRARGRSRRGCASACSTSPRASSASGATRSGSATWSRPTSCPRKMITGPTLDVRMSARATFEQALEHRRPRRRGRQRQAAARAEGRLLGLGFSTFIEAAPGPPDFGAYVMGGGERRARRASPPASCSRTTARCRCSRSRCPTARATRRRSRRSRPTSSACPIEQVRVRFGDTAITPFGLVGHRREPVGGDGRRRGHRRRARRCASASSTSPPTCSRRAPRGPRGQRRRGARGRACRRSRCRSPTSRPRSRARRGPAAGRGDPHRRRLGRRRGRVGAGDARVLGRGRPRTPAACTSRATSWSRTAASSSTRSVVDGQIARRRRAGHRRGALREDGLRRPTRRSRPARSWTTCSRPRRRSPRSRSTTSRRRARHRGQLPRGRRGRHDRRAGGHHQRDRGRARAPRRAHHRAAPPAGAHPRARRRDHSRRV